MRASFVAGMKLVGRPFAWGTRGRRQLYVLGTVIFGVFAGGLFVYLVYSNFRPQPPWWFAIFLVAISALGGLA